METNKEYFNQLPINNNSSPQINPKSVIDKKEIIKVEDYIIPEIITKPVYVVHSAWFKDRNQGVLFIEQIDPRSWFYPVQKYHIMQFTNLEKLKEEHIKLVGQLDWRLNKNGTGRI